MADIKIKIDLQSTTEDVISGISSAEFNNVSKITPTTTKNDGVVGLSFAKNYLKFNDGILSNFDGTSGVAQMERGYNGFMFGAVAEDKTYTCTITITGTNIDGIHIYGDKTAQQFPTEAYLDGNSENLIYNDDYDWAIRFTSPQNSHSITFTKWNRPNYNACITHLAVLMNELWLDKSWIKGVESLSQSTASPNDIFYGILANSGSANIIDRNGEILDYIEDGVLDNSNLPMTIYSNGKEVQYHIINDSDYDTNSITLSIEMNNDLNDWDILQYGGRSLTSETTAYVVLSDVLLSINYTQVEIDEMLDTEIVYGTENTEGSVKAYLQAITIPYPYLEADTMRNTIEKFCNLAQLQVFKNSGNKIKFVSARPVATTTQLSNTLVVPAKNQQSQLKEAKVLKNKYKNPFVSYSIFTHQNGIFGDVKNITVKEDTGNYEDHTFSGKVVKISLYDEVYNTIKNPYYNNTEIITRTRVNDIYTLTTTYYKTSLSINVPNNVLVNDISSLKFNLKMTAYGSNADTEVFGGGYSPYKTIIYTEILENSVFQGAVLIENKEIKNNIISFDVLIVKGWSVSPSPSGIIPFILPTKTIISCDIQLYGDTYSYVFNTSENNDIEIKGNEILQENTKLENTEINSIISDNIINDYVNGISNATITITCGDYYDKNGVKAKDWANGDLINVGDIVRVDKDNNGNSASVYKNGTPRIWRVTGRKFRYAGVPLCDLELQEIKQG